MAIPNEVFEQTLLKFLIPVKPFLDDPSVTEIMINGPDQIFIERKGKLYITDARFPSREALEAAMGTSRSSSVVTSTTTGRSSRGGCRTAPAWRRCCRPPRPTGRWSRSGASRRTP